MDAKPEQQSSKPLVGSFWQPQYVPSSDPGTGYLLFMREGTLMAQPFDNRRLELKGQATPVADQVDDIRGGSGGYAAFSASANVLVFRRRAGSDRQFTRYDRGGKVLGTAGEPANYQGSPALSPDGMRLAVTISSGKAYDIWLLDLSRGGAATRFTFGSAEDVAPVWSPDGSRIIFASGPKGSSANLYQKPANGARDEEPLLKSDDDTYPSSWSSDGRFLLYDVSNPVRGSDIWVLPPEGNRKPVPFLKTEFDESSAHFSPDGHWVAYESDESGRPKVYVRPFSMDSAGTAVETGGKWQISSGSGREPRWHRDGRELYYRSRDGGVMAVDIATGPAFLAGMPHPVGPLPDPKRPFPPALWDITADGKFLLASPVDGGLRGYTVVLNWQSGLKK